MSTNRPASLHELVHRYYQAYNDRDVEAILALQTPDAEYRLHGAQEPMCWIGADACRTVYEHHLRAWPDQRLECRSVVISGDLSVCHVVLTGTLAVPWHMAGRTYEPTGNPATFEIVHIMQCEGNLVKIKDGWTASRSITSSRLAQPDARLTVFGRSDHPAGSPDGRRRGR